MKIFLLALTTLLLFGCKEEPQPGTEYANDYIYLRDTTGRCLRIETHLSTYGSQTSQFGHLRVREMPEPCHQ